jgi:nucleotide-binding universal stress UspA family protein
MLVFKHILIPTDFGEASQAALDLARSLAVKFDAKLTLAHAYTIPVTGYDGLGLTWPVDELQRAAKTALDDAFAKARELYPKTESVLLCGEPWQQILDVAKERGADLIVMGTHGRRGLSRVFLGSVAEKVVRLSPIPVLTVSGKSDREAKEAASKQADEPARR